LNTYLMLTTRTDQFNQKHTAGHYGIYGPFAGRKTLKNVRAFQRRHRRSIRIKAGSLEEAREIGQADPLVFSGSSELTIKEWKLK